MNTGIIFGQVYHGAIRAFNEANALIQKEENNVFLLCYNDTDTLAQENNGRLQITKLPYNKSVVGKIFGINNTVPIFDWVWTKHIKRFILENKIETLLVHDIFMLPASLSAVKKLGKKIEITVNLHENYPAVVKTYSWAKKTPQKYLARPEKWEKLEGQLLTQVDKIIALSEPYRDDLITKYPTLKKEQFFVLPNIPNLQTLTQYKVKEIDLQKEKGDLILFYFGVIGARRGIITCLEALELIVPKFPAVKLLLVGPVDSADRNTFNTLIEKPSIKDNVIYVDWIDMSEFPSYAAFSDVCLCPIIKNEQHESGVANKIFQYMWAGKPLIVSNCAPQQLIVEQENCGLVFNSEDAPNLAEKIAYSYLNPDKLKAFGENGKKAVLKKYNLENYSNNFLKFIHSN